MRLSDCARSHPHSFHEMKRQLFHYYREIQDLGNGERTMPHKRVTLNAGGSLPSVELQFGNAFFAKYDLYLYDRNGANPQDIAVNQTNGDNIPDVFTIGANLPDLDQRILFWQAAISVFDNQLSQTYLMRAIVSQDGTVLGTFDKTGPITNTVIDQDTVRFVLGGT